MSINKNWVFGNGAGLDFSSSTPVPLSGFQINTAEGCASISDAAGTLLFYTDGQTVWDNAGTVRATGLMGNASSTQSAIIVPDPGNDKRYYVFTADGASGGNQHVNGIRLDLSAPVWTVTQLSTLLTMPPTAGFSSTEKITAIQHANCVDYWVGTIVQKSPVDVASGPAFFRLFLVTAAGVQSLPDVGLGVDIGDLGYMKGSPDGKRLAIADFENRVVLVYNFDSATGAVSASVTIPVPPVASFPTGHPRVPYGVEFSPNSSVLYYSVLGNSSVATSDADGFVFQVDLSVSAPASLQVIQHPNPDGLRYSLAALQLGIDGRIYVAKDDEGSLGAIQSPNIVGLGCNPNINFLSLPSGATCKMGLPNLLPNPCPTGCEEITANLNQYLAESCAKKVNRLLPCTGHPAPCPCTTPEPAGGRKCLTAEFPKLEPCIAVSWGDSRCDCLETDDTEVLCITVCNCYSNVTFQDFRIAVAYVTTDQGVEVPVLPDGSLSVEAFPRGPLCFGDIGPCKPGSVSCVSRQLVVIARGAKGGTYQLQLRGICFDVVHHYDQKACFRLDLCPDR